MALIDRGFAPRVDKNCPVVWRSTPSTRSISYAVDDATIADGWNWVDLVLETYGVDQCDEYARGTASFLDMRLVDVEGASLTPTWTSNPYIDGWPGAETP